MKLTGFIKEHYDYVKDGRRIEGDTYSLYFSYRIPQMLGAGVASVAYPVTRSLNNAIASGQQILLLGGDYDLIFDENKINYLVPVENNENKKKGE